MIQFIVVSSFFLQDYISFILAWTFISLQIKEFRIMGLSINNSVYSCVFFFLTGLHFFHLLLFSSLGSWVYQLIIQFIVVSSFFLQDYISFIFSLVFFFFLSSSLDLQFILTFSSSSWFALYL